MGNLLGTSSDAVGLVAGCGMCMPGRHYVSVGPTTMRGVTSHLSGGKYEQHT